MYQICQVITTAWKVDLAVAQCEDSCNCVCKWWTKQEIVVLLVHHLLCPLLYISPGKPGWSPPPSLPLLLLLRDIVTRGEYVEVFNRKWVISCHSCLASCHTSCHTSTPGVNVLTFSTGNRWWFLIYLFSKLFLLKTPISIFFLKIFPLPMKCQCRSLPARWCSASSDSSQDALGGVGVLDSYCQ